MTKTVPENVDPIVTTIVPETALGDTSGDQDNDDRRWIETVLATLPDRSREARMALAKALLDGDAKPDPVGCATLQEPSRIEHLSHADDAACGTSMSHTDHHQHRPTDCSSGKISSIVCGTTVGGRGTRLPLQGTQRMNIVGNTGNCFL